MCAPIHQAKAVAGGQLEEGLSGPVLDHLGLCQQPPVTSPVIRGTEMQSGITSGLAGCETVIHGGVWIGIGTVGTAGRYGQKPSRRKCCYGRASRRNRIRNTEIPCSAGTLGHLLRCYLCY